MWLSTLFAGAVLIATMPGLAALLPIGVVGVIAEVRHQRVKAQMRAELRQIVSHND